MDVLKILSSFHVKWFTDNQGEARIVQLNTLQDLQKATNWGDMCGSRRERMALVLCCHIAWHILLV